MPSDTWDAYGAVVKLALTALHDNVYANASSVVSDVDAVLDGLDGDQSDRVAAAIKEFRANFSGLIDRAAVRNLLDPILEDFASVIGWTGPINADFWIEMRRYQSTNTKTFQSRQITHGTWSAGGSNTGNGLPYWLVTNAQNREIEQVDLTLLTLECIRDQTNGTEAGREVFEFRQGRPKDNLENAGTGQSALITAISGDVDNLLGNASFQTFDGTAAEPNGLGDWVLTDGSDAVLTPSSTYVTIDSTNVYRTSPEEDAQDQAYALNLKATCKLKQFFKDQGISFEQDEPAFGWIRWNRAVGSATGTLKVVIAGQEVSVAVSAQSGWQTLVFDLDNSNWPEVFTSDAPAFEVDWTRTGGELLVDDAGFVKMSELPKHGHLVMLGGTTPFKFGDTFTVTPALSGTEGKLQKLTVLGYGDENGYWHHADSTPTITDP